MSTNGISSSLQYELMASVLNSIGNEGMIGGSDDSSSSDFGSTDQLGAFDTILQGLVASSQNGNSTPNSAETALLSVLGSGLDGSSSNSSGSSDLSSLSSLSGLSALSGLNSTSGLNSLNGLSALNGLNSSSSTSGLDGLNNLGALSELQSLGNLNLSGNNYLGPLTYNNGSSNASNSNFSSGNSAIDQAVNNASQKYGVDKNLIMSVMEQESDFNPDATSSAGAMGLMQLMPGTASELGVTNPYDINQNIDGGTKYLKSLLDTFGSNKLAIAAYNAGPGAVQNSGGDMEKLPSETRDYVSKVSSYYNNMSKLV